MSAHKLSIPELEKRRSQAVSRGSFGQVILTVTDPETRGGVVICNTSMGRGRGDVRLEATFFRPAQMNRGFANASIKSAHDAMGALNLLRDKIATEKREKTAAHDFKVGDIICAMWGVTMRGARFYQVVNVPKPRKVTLVQIEQKMVRGDWMDGEVMPILPENTFPADHDQAFDYKAFVKKEVSYVDMGNITHARKWDEKPAYIHGD